MKLYFVILLLLILLYIFKYNKTTEHFTHPNYTSYGNDDVAFIYYYDDNIYNYAQHSLKNIKAYLEKYKYGLYIFNKEFNSEYSPCWNKIASILEVIRNHKYVVWVDADIVINNFNIDIMKFANNDTDHDLFICFDCVKDKECLNSGVMIVKNTVWSYNLFKKTWETDQFHGHNDQNVLLDEIIKENNPEYKDGSYDDNKYRFKPYCKETMHPKVKIFDQNSFNTHIEDVNYDDFIIHLMGADAYTRINVMRQINTKLGLDDYADTTCVKLLKKYKTSEERTNKLKENSCYKYKKIE